MSRENTDPLKVIVYMDEYTELVRKAALYDELVAGRLSIKKDINIIGGEIRNE